MIAEWLMVKTDIMGRKSMRWNLASEGTKPFLAADPVASRSGEELIVVSRFAKQ